MKCDCKYCNGTGTRRCDDCDGSGQADLDIDEIRIERDTPNGDALRELKSDAARVRRQADELTRLRPSHARFYESQLHEALAKINNQADNLGDDQD
jgi:DnaJ-class molecular chaperone